ncbi:glycosyltransferase [Porphyrobacter algicida]|uniref:Glycosyltransferase n=1 Tax=Qipengyuania algicida TaxID=1836209 RepID=A0A845ANW1_9SPHN|nr:glycosyltransferase [Qipengyuania algicida]
MPLTILCLELLAGLWSGSGGTLGGTPKSISVLIPAHDEATGIAATVEALKSVAPRNTQILVVADNCSDDTAERARTAGAQVIERHDTVARGKGYALAFGRDYLAEQAGGPPDVVIVLDADCRLGEGSLEALSAIALQRGTPTQAINLISPDLGAPPMVQISSFAMLVKNLFRSRGMQRLGGAALLTGTGMALPWQRIANAKLATGSIVEDLALGIELTREGYPPYLVEHAHVRSAPADMRDALQQRKRWEHGFLDCLKNLALPVFSKGLKRWSRAEILLGLHLMVPPLALTMAVASMSFVVVCLLGWLGAQIAPAVILGILLAVAVALVLLAWLIEGQAFLSAKTLLRIPLYVLWKIPIYASFLRKPQANWNRTPRRNDQGSEDK